MNATHDSLRRPIGITPWWVRIPRWVAAIMWLFSLVGLVLRFTVRDRFQPWAVLYYMTPIPVLAFLFLLAGWLWSRRTDVQHMGQDAGARRSTWRPLSKLSLLAGCVCGIWTWLAEFPTGVRSAPVEATQLLFWNVGHCRLGANRIAEQIRHWDMPIVALVESSMTNEPSEEFWRTELSGYSTAMIHKDSLLAVKGEVVSQRGHRLSALSRCDQFDIRLNGRGMTVLIVDVASNLFVSREDALGKLADIVSDLNDRPVIIVGDFNTPDDSVWFEPLRQQARSGIRSAGSGYAATWPNPLPVLALDQLWFNRHCNIFSCRAGWTALSDHRPLFTVLRTAMGENSVTAPPSPNLK